MTEEKKRESNTRKRRQDQKGRCVGERASESKKEQVRNSYKEEEMQR